MNLFNYAMVIAMLNLCIHGLPMHRQQKAEATSPRYELITEDQADQHRATELGFASTAATNHALHNEQRDRLNRFDPMQIYHKKAVKKELNKFHSHLDNIKHLSLAEATGAVKLTKSPSGKKDVYNAATKEQYYQHNPNNRPSTSRSNHKMV